MTAQVHDHPEIRTNQFSSSQKRKFLRQSGIMWPSEYQTSTSFSAGLELHQRGPRSIEKNTTAATRFQNRNKFLEHLRKKPFTLLPRIPNPKLHRFLHQLSQQKKAHGRSKTWQPLQNAPRTSSMVQIPSVSVHGLSSFRVSNVKIPGACIRNPLPSPPRNRSNNHQGQTKYYLPF